MQAVVEPCPPLSTAAEPDAPGARLQLRTLIAHDWLVEYGGSERVVEQLRALLPNSRLLTTVRRGGELPPALADSDTTFLQRIPGAASHHQWLLPLMPLAWRTAGVVDGVDIVISSSHACAKAIRVAPGIPHLCYCHTPMRYAWDFRAEQDRLPRALRRPAAVAMAAFRAWDRATGSRVDLFVANSTAVASRIAHAYRRTAHVVFPPVDTSYFSPGGKRGDYFLYVGRLVSYKRADLVVEAFRGLPHELRVIGRGHLESTLRANAPANVKFVRQVSREALRAHYRETRALIVPGVEDFGIAMAEAQACCTPVIAAGAGGALDIVSHGRTGLLVPNVTVEALRAAVREYEESNFDEQDLRSSASRFSTERFREEMARVVVDVRASGLVRA